ncbi:DUF2171 domain-containing protein [Sphingomonas humi]|uniref:DUF2171 domain-containing protein n=1 Tax=Sphingomonas humi TaxID=335630 RepID=A0ABP7RYG6_9SPHN
MAYDRYDDRDNRGYRDDRQRGTRSGGNDDRGFFDRAIDSVSNFFNDDDSGSREDESRTRYGQTQQSGRSSYEPRAYDQDEGRQRGGREDDRFGRSDRGALFGGGQSSSLGRGRDEGDYRNQYGRGGGESGGFGRGDYGSQNNDSFGRQDRDTSSLGQNRTYPSSYNQTGSGSYRDTQGQSLGGGQNRYDQDRSQRGFQSQGSDRYRPMTGDYGRGSLGQGGRSGSGMGGQDFGQQQFGSQDRFQDQDSDQHRSASYYGQTDRGQSAFGQSGQSAFGGSGMRSPHDEHYSSWRQRQIEDLDRDYDEYCREHQSRFENEFSGFRQQRQTKRQLLQSIREHAEVVDETGQHIGTVDKVRGEKVILTKNDPEAHGVHRSFTCSLLDRVEDGKVYLTGTKDSIRSRLTEERDEGKQDGGMLGGLFGGSTDDTDRRSPQATTNQPTGLSGQTGTGTSTGEGPHILDQSFSGTYEDGDSSTTGSRTTKK